MKKYFVQTGQADQRLDHFLVEQLKTSRKKVKQLIDEGRVFLGEKKIIIASWKLQSGDCIEIHESSDIKLPRRQRYLKIYYEDSDLLVLEKPAGVACEASPQTLTATLVDDINDYLCRAHPEKPHPYIGLMHRLDRETSGVMVYSLSHRANRLSEQFKQHKIKRHYQVMVEKSVSSSQGRIDWPIKKVGVGKNKKVKVLKSLNSDGQQAITEYRVLQRYPRATLIQCVLHTGRTHQIRAHMAALGHPVLGDPQYGGHFNAARHMIHASFLEFHHPISGKKLKFSSPPPSDFKKALEKIQNNALGFKKGPASKKSSV